MNPQTTLIPATEIFRASRASAESADAVVKEHRPLASLTLWVVELLEINPPQDIKGQHWVLYTMEPVTTIAHADLVIAWYNRRPTIEDYHKAFKTGCHVQERYDETSERLERVTALLSVVAVRLMQLKTAALETPDRPARELAPIQWVRRVGNTQTFQVKITAPAADDSLRDSIECGTDWHQR